MNQIKNRPEFKKEAYWCNKCKRFHKPNTKGKPSITHLEHFVYIARYISEYTQAELFKLSFKKAWKRESNHPSSRGN